MEQIQTSETQGYNILHLVTHSSSIMPLLYLIHQLISVDEHDIAAELKVLIHGNVPSKRVGLQRMVQCGRNPLSDVSVPIDWDPPGTNVGDTPQRNTKLAIFIIPTIFLYMIFMTLTILCDIRA